VSPDGGTKIEAVYAAHSNRLKALANEARRELVATKSTPYSESARKVYAPQVESLTAKLNLAMRNRPLERQAQLLANAVVQAKRDANPDMDKTEYKKLSGQALQEARRRTGADKKKFIITPDEWRAIQEGAITNHRLEEILNVADLDQVRQLAMPRTERVMTPAKAARARSMSASGYTQAEIASQLGVSLTTVKQEL
jgi:hypothetical protein